MKRTIRKLSVLVLSIFLLFALCSCGDLSQMRESQAVWGDESRDTILWKDATYRRLEGVDTSLLSSANFSSSREGLVTEADVPVLLAEFFGDYFWASDEEDILSVYEGTYVLESEYEKLLKELKNPIYSRFFYVYEEYGYGEKDFYEGVDEDYLTDGMLPAWGSRPESWDDFWTTHRHELTKAELDEIRQMYERGTERSLLDDDYTYYSYMGEIIMTTDSGRISKTAYDVYYDEDENYYLRSYGDETTNILLSSEDQKAFFMIISE